MKLRGKLSPLNFNFTNYLQANHQIASISSISSAVACIRSIAAKAAVISII